MTEAQILTPHALYEGEVARTQAAIREIDLSITEDDDLIAELQRRQVARRLQLVQLEREQAAAKRGLAVLEGVAP